MRQTYRTREGGGRKRKRYCMRTGGVFSWILYRIPKTVLFFFFFVAAQCSNLHGGASDLFCHAGYDLALGAYPEKKGHGKGS